VAELSTALKNQPLVALLISLPTNPIDSVPRVFETLNSLGIDRNEPMAFNSSPDLATCTK
jgi:hypothetical protein